MFADEIFLLRSSNRQQWWSSETDIKHCTPRMLTKCHKTTLLWNKLCSFCTTDISQLVSPYVSVSQVNAGFW